MNTMGSEAEAFDRCRACCVTTADLSRAGWQARYDAGQTGWDRGQASPMLSQWLAAGDLQPCQILVPGCGRGHEVLALAEAGFEVTAIDFAESAVQALRAELDRRSLNANVIQTDIFAFCQRQEFDAVYEQTSLCAIHPTQWETYQQLLACWLRPEGKLFALFMQSERSDGPPYCCELNQMRALFPPTAWAWDSDPQRIEHPSGMHELACVLTRKESEP